MCGFRSFDRIAAYAVPASWCDASMTLMLPATLFGGVTFAHVLPPSRVTWMKPVLDPTQITPRPPTAAGEGARDVIEPPAAGAPTPVGAPTASGGSVAPGGRAKSVLITRHVRALSLDASTCWAAMYRVRPSCENASGGAPPNRSVAVG